VKRIYRNSRAENDTLAGPARVLVADDEPQARQLFRQVLEKEEYQVDAAAHGDEVIELVRAREPYDLLLVDLNMPPVDGLDLLRRVKQISPTTLVIITTGHASVESAINALKMGAHDYILKPIHADDLTALVRRGTELQRIGEDRRRTLEELEAERRKNRDLQQDLRARYARTNLLGSSPAMQAVRDTIQEVARTDSPVLILGESGTGKGLVARAIHYGGDRADQPFVVANCTLYSDGVLDSELFGHEKGAFTGAARPKQGRFELAGGGTIFLDEIRDLPPNTQAMLLRVVQERQFERLGGEETLSMDARILAATSRDLTLSLADGTLREDLFNRLNVIPIHVPALRDRANDIPVLAASLLAKTSERLLKPAGGFSQDAIGALCGYGWPGNVRELENVVERALLMAKGDEIRAEDLPAEIAQPVETAGHTTRLSLEEVERLHILRVLEAYSWNKKRSAEVLEINRSSLYNKLRRWGINDPSGN